MGQEQLVRRPRRPCRQCGRRYFVRRIALSAVLVTLLAFGGGVWYGISHRYPLALIAAFLVGTVALVTGRRYRCINCDTGA
jgi:hypothetical protein